MLSTVNSAIYWLSSVAREDRVINIIVLALELARHVKLNDLRQADDATIGCPSQELDNPGRSIYSRQLVILRQADDAVVGHLSQELNSPSVVKIDMEDDLL